MLVQDDVFKEFVDRFVDGAKGFKVGNGLDPDSKMGSLANPRRVTAIEDKGSALFHFALVAPAVDFARVEEVLLLTGQSTQDVAGLFIPGG